MTVYILINVNGYTRLFFEATFLYRYVFYFFSSEQIITVPTRRAIFFSFDMGVIFVIFKIGMRLVAPQTTN